jgi:hypothetical protein
VEHQGIKYQIKMAPGLKEWVWVVDLPRPRQGALKGSRDRAIDAAKRVIDAFCRQNPANCAASPQ